MNNFAQRGVLNSSVTSTALNDITHNAADVTAQNCLNNINTLQNLAQTALGNTNQNLYNTALSSRTNIAQQQLTNTLGTIGGTGTTTSTQTSSGGGFLSGLFGGIF